VVSTKTERATSVTVQSAPGRLTQFSRTLALPEVRWAVAATTLFVLGGALQAAGAPHWTWLALYLICYACGGWEPALSGLRAARLGTLDVDLLMIVAAIVAAAIGQIFDGALLIVIFASSGALEAFATKRTADSVQALLTLAPTRSSRMTPEGVEEVVNTQDLIVGDLILVRPGELIGADGAVIDGLSDVDQATITGEPLPVAKQVGDEVFAGTMNGNGVLTLRVSRAASDSVVARIVALVEQASATKATTQLFIEKIEQRYSVGVVIATLALFFLPIAFGVPLDTALLRAMTFMIVASPCAVVLATMPPLLAAIANAGRHGLLVKSAVVMEQLGQSDLIAFDKTGTLTEGRPHLTRVHVLPGSATDEDGVLMLAASAERSSEHPLARAIVAAAEDRGLAVAAVENFRSEPGRGVSVSSADRLIQVGSPALLRHADAASVERTEVTRVVADIESTGQTAVLVLVNQAPMGVLSLSDKVRVDATNTVRQLTELTGRSPVLLTGDNDVAAQRLAKHVGITEVHAQLLPGAKAELVAGFQKSGRHVLLVGDGVNDAPAMATADVGVAMGRNGSDLVLETSDAVIVRDDLTTLGSAIGLSRRARRVVSANLVIAGTVIVGLVAWDIVGHLPLPLGVAGHEGSTVIVGLNGLRMLNRSAWGRSPA
jgi:heavy metal translocating P-type ATPase